MSDPLSEIKAKCEQYMGYHGGSVGMPEVHAILSIIHTRAMDAGAEIDRLKAKVKTVEPKLAYAVTVFQKINEKFWIDWVADGAPEGSKEERRDWLLGGISHAEEALAALREGDSDGI